MAIERTFSIIKPDATQRNLTGTINAMIEQAGLRIVAQKRLQMSRAQAETFYAVHRARPFFGELVAFMTSGPVVVQVLEGENAIAKYRDLMGAVVRIVWMKILLSGANAVVIAMACRSLPPRERLWGMVIGAGVAAVLRSAFTAVAAKLMTLPYLKLVGAVALFWIAFRLLVSVD